MRDQYYRTASDGFTVRMTVGRERLWMRASAIIDTPPACASVIARRSPLEVRVGRPKGLPLALARLHQVVDVGRQQLGLTSAASISLPAAPVRSTDRLPR
jgi:hypothetical protein